MCVIVLGLGEQTHMTIIVVDPQAAFDVARAPSIIICEGYAPTTLPRQRVVDPHLGRRAP